MGADIYAVRQSTDNQHLRTQCAEVSNESSDDILSVGGAMACSHDVYHMPLVEVGTTFVVEKQWSIRTLAEALGIVGITDSQHADVVLCDKLHLSRCPMQCVFPMFHRFTQSRRSLWHNITNVVAVVIDGLAAAQCLVQLQCHLLVETCHAGQGYRVVYFVGHCFLSL